MSITSQAVNEHLASGVKLKNLPAGDLKSGLKSAEKYLKSHSGNKPEWLDGFLETNKQKLNETIIRAISSPEGIESLRGYTEGYFNEIVQNANDLGAGDCIEIRVDKSDSVYSVECRYKDEGFSLSNIYAFLNLEMSDKSAEEGQTGKFGVGIKSFFKFVRKFKIISNVIFDFTIDRTQIKAVSDVFVNDQWRKGTTVLYFEYDINEAKSSDFNLGKLSDLIDFLVGISSVQGEDVSKFFLSEKNDELVFDIHSMVFMNNNQKKKPISELKFYGSTHSISVTCTETCDTQRIEYESETWGVRNVVLSLTLDDEECEDCKYIVFNHGKLSIGFPLSYELEGTNRFYSTYYIKSDSTQKLLPIGLIIDTPFANIHRDDLGNNEKSITDAYKKIQEAMIQLYPIMCSKQASALQCSDELSDTFHWLLFRYFDEDCEEYKESPYNVEGLDNQFLPKISGDSRTDIVFHKAVENYERATPVDRESVVALTQLYFETIERGNVIDYDELMRSSECIDGVERIYKKLHAGKDTDNYQTASEILHYYAGVAEYISYIVSGEYREKPMLSDSEIDLWLCRLQDERGERYDQELCLKLIGRYQLNAALAFDGKLIQEKLSFKDYIFNGIPELKNGFLSDWQNKQFDSQYSELKKQLLGNRLTDPGNTPNIFLVRYMIPCGTSRRRWDWSTYDCFSQEHMECKVSEYNKYILLEKIATDDEIMRSVSMYSMRLFSITPVSMRYRVDYFKHHIIRSQQIICIDFLRRIQLVDFGMFLRAVEYKKRIEEYHGNVTIQISCNQKEVPTHDIITDFLPKLVTLPKDKYVWSDVIFDQVVETTNNELPQENSDFIFKLSGYRIHVSRFDSNSKKHVIAYWGNNCAKIRMDASSSFSPMAAYRSSSNDIYIFYDNLPDINAVVSTVLGELDIQKDLMELLLGYIHNGNNTKTINYLSRRRTFAKVKKSLVLDWAAVSPDCVHEIGDTEIIYRLLTARGSYDIYCPICADIPLETFDYGEDTKKKHSRRIIVMENENMETKHDFPYIVTVACSYCFERLRHTMSKSEFDGKRLTLTTQVAQGQHEKMKSRHQLELSPVNIMIMKRIKFGLTQE